MGDVGEFSSGKPEETLGFGQVKLGLSVRLTKRPPNSRGELLGGPSYPSDNCSPHG